MEQLRISKDVIKKYIQGKPATLEIFLSETAHTHAIFGKDSLGTSISFLVRKNQTELEPAYFFGKRYMYISIILFFQIIEYFLPTKWEKKIANHVRKCKNFILRMPF
nr:uncharacterized protein LOC121123925 [Lepeophtheirus salmonis]XP_040575927.1 uncharacterized protein LOC121124793 [Lepeophtheirus salmonis]